MQNDKSDKSFFSKAYLGNGPKSLLFLSPEMHHIYSTKGHVRQLNPHKHQVYGTQQCPKASETHKNTTFP